MNPAIAIADAIRRREPDAEILFAGREKGLENRLVHEAGYDMRYVEIQGIRRSLSPSNLKTAYLAAVSPYRAKKILKEFRPDIAIGTGGYVCWPVLRAAAMLGIPSAVHESNAVPGVATKMLANYVDRIWLNFEETGEELKQKEKLLRVGNPLRGGFSDLSYEAARSELGIRSDEFFILSYGGSLGAEQVNHAVLRLMKEFSAVTPGVRHLHATGSIEHEDCLAEFHSLGLEETDSLRLTEYIYDMPVQMAAADVVISRSGAMTVSELSMKGKVSILIPSPNVTNQHQLKNAKVLADAGAAVLLEEKNLGEKPLAGIVRELLENPDRRTAMGQAVRSFAIPDANDRILDDISELIRRMPRTK